MLIRSILVPTDGSEIATHALAYACDLARLLNATVHVCYGIDYLSLPGTLEKDPESAPTVLREDGEAILERARALARERGLEIDGHLIRGGVAEAVNRLATTSGVDLIVMGTHGRTGLSRLVLGSVAEGVVRNAPVPVLLVRDGKK